MSNELPLRDVASSAGGPECLIWDEGEYRHLWFNHVCADDRGEILAGIELLFEKLQMLDGVWHVRVAPQIDRMTEQDTGRSLAKVYCRISSRIPVKREGPEIDGFGLMQI